MTTPRAGPALRPPDARRDARASRSWRSRRWRSASAPTPRSSASSTRCCCGRCPTRRRTGWSWSGRTCARAAARRRVGDARATSPTGRRDGRLRRRWPRFSGWQPSAHRRRRPGAARRRAGDARVLRRARHRAGARPHRSAPTTTCRTRRAWRSSATRCGSGGSARDRPVDRPRSITLSGEPHEIIGVMPAGFRRS